MHGPEDLIHFGKFKGAPWRAPDASYLNFFIDFGEECKYELDRRAAEEEMAGGPALAYLGRVKRILAQQFHPDKPGGSTEEMQKLNQFFDYFKTTIDWYQECEASEGVQERTR
jgi:hypothetical protein